MSEGGHLDVKPADLGSLVQTLADEASTATSGRSSRMLVHGPHQRALALALRKGAALADHEAPRAATLQILSGSADLTVGDESLFLKAGDLVAIPQARHGLLALEPTVALLTLVI